MSSEHIITLSCKDRPGIVATITTALAESGANIREAQQFNDVPTDGFFMRVVFELTDPSVTAERMRAEFAPIGAEHGMEWKIRLSTERQRVLLLVSKFDHCLGDLLYRHRIGELAMDVVGIISNHPRSALQTTMVGDIPYHQAHARGVKMIGATAHYVTADLDEGPIIAQDVEPISHADTPDDLVRKGRDIERRVLAAAVAYHLEDRVLLNGSRTVVFRN